MEEEQVNLWEIKDALSGACFHGEVWVRCPYCKEAHEMVGSTPLIRKDGYDIYRCDCGKLFKNR